MLLGVFKVIMHICSCVCSHYVNDSSRKKSFWNLVSLLHGCNMRLQAQQVEFSIAHHDPSQHNISNHHQPHKRRFFVKLSRNLLSLDYSFHGDMGLHFNSSQSSFITRSGCNRKSIWWCCHPWVGIQINHNHTISLPIKSGSLYGGLL